MRHVLILIVLLPLVYLVLLHNKVDLFEQQEHSPSSPLPAVHAINALNESVQPMELPRQTRSLKCEMNEYVRYSREADSFFSPARHSVGGRAPVKERKYVLFGFDPGGLNNVWMAFEVAVVFAHASGRILVMPPKKKLYLLDKDPDLKDNDLVLRPILI